MPQSWIQPNQNSFLETFAQAEQLKNYRSTNALNEAKAAELPYAREREEALNAAQIAKAEAQTGKAQSDARNSDGDFAMKMAEFVARDPGNEQAVLGAFQFGVDRFPALGGIAAKLESQRGTPAFAETAASFAMSAKDKAAQQLDVAQFGEQQRHNQAGEGVAQAHLGVAQARLGQDESQFARSEAGKFARADARLQAEGGAQDTRLRQEFNLLPEVKNYKTVIPIVQSAREAVDIDTPAADMNLVYAAAKVMDPESVVRESETEMVVKSGSPAQQWLGQWEYIKGGGRLTPATRRQLMNEVESRAKGHENLYTGTLEQYQSGAPKIGSLPLLRAGRASAQPPSTGFQPPSAGFQIAPDQGPSAPQSKAEFDALPSGARFTDPTGQIRVKP
ncbi:MAG: hypothetical protein H0T87_03040 [Gammaproteobacteria bacterium]|nr:hypothetical protein [Gammaproteobacteria bacterium]